MREKVEFLHLFLLKEEVSGFQAIRDMRHTKLDFHAKFHPKKFEARGTFAQKSLMFAPFLPKEEVSGFQAIRDMHHTKLDFHAEFHPKKFEARGTFAQKSRIFAPFLHLPGILMREKVEFLHLFCPKRKYPDFKQYGTCAIQC